MAVKHVLIVDDHVESLVALRAVLEEAGHQVETYRGAAEARKAIDPLLVEIAILDVRMPGISGPEFARELLNLNRAIQIIFVTAYPVPEELKDIPNSSVLTKPLNISALLEIVWK